MSNIIPIDQNEPHLTGELICLRCGYRYVGVWNEKSWLKDLECPYCHITGFLIGTGQILESHLQDHPHCDKDNPYPQSKPGQILLFKNDKEE